MLVTSCVSAPWTGFPPADAGHVWPGAPEPPRVGFVMEIRSHEDLFRETGMGAWVGRVFGGATDSSMVHPYAVAMHPGDGLLVADTGRNGVHFYDLRRRRYVWLGGEGEAALPSPVAVAALPDGTILVADSRRATVEAFEPEGDHLGSWIASGTLGRPAGLACDPIAGRVYVSDSRNHRVGIFNFQGAPVSWMGERGVGPDQFNFPTHLAVGPDGRLYVSDTLNFRVQVFERDGSFVRSIGSLGATPGQFSHPKGVAADALGRVVIVEGRYDALEFFSPEGELLLHLGSPGQGKGEFWLPAGLWIDPAEGLIFVADSYNRRVQVFRFLDSSGSTKGSTP